MRLSASQQAAAFPPMRRRQRRSISVIPSSLLSAIELCDKPTHKRSQSLATTSYRGGEMVDDSLPFIFQSSSRILDTQAGFPAGNDPDERSIVLQPRYSKPRLTVGSDEDEVSLVNDFSCRFSLESADEEVGVGVGFDCPMTPKCQLSRETMEWLSPPALGKPSYIFLDISSSADSDLFLPDSF